MGMGGCEAWLIVTFFPWIWGELRAASDIVDTVSGHDWFGHCFQKRAWVSALLTTQHPWGLVTVPCFVN